MRLRNLTLIISAFILVACGTTSGADTTPTKETVCDKIVPPIEEKLETFTFFQLPPGATQGEGGVDLKAALTSDGVVAILSNYSKLKKRETQWQGRASAINECLAKEASQRAAREKANKS